MWSYYDLILIVYMHMEMHKVLLQAVFASFPLFLL